MEVNKENLSEFELSQQVVKKMKDEGWCDGCSANYEDCYKNGICKGGEK